MHHCNTESDVHCAQPPAADRRWAALYVAALHRKLHCMSQRCIASLHRMLHRMFQCMLHRCASYDAVLHRMLQCCTCPQRECGRMYVYGMRCTHVAWHAAHRNVHDASFSAAVYINVGCAGSRERNLGADVRGSAKIGRGRGRHSSPVPMQMWQG